MNALIACRGLWFQRKKKFKPSILFLQFGLRIVPKLFLTTPSPVEFTPSFLSDFTWWRDARLSFLKAPQSIQEWTNFLSPLQISVNHQSWSGWSGYGSGNRRGGKGKALAENIPFPLFVLGPRAAGKCLSEHTLVLFLSQPNLEVARAPNCASVGSKFWKETERSGGLRLESLMD